MAADTAPPLFENGDLLDDRWAVECVLPGAMGSVLILVDPTTGSRMAAKTPRTDLDLDAAALRRFKIEARNWLTLGTHPNVVEASFLEEIEVGGQMRPFLFLEYVDGPTLQSVLDAEGRLAVAAALDVGTGVAWGMAHAQGEERAGSRLVHRDLKPDNVFLTSNRVVKVSDFGIARALDRPEDVAAEGAGLGTPLYAAPEQLKDARAAGPQSDVYAYGALLHHLLTGAPPFPAETLGQLMWKVLHEVPPPVSSLVSGVPESLDRLILDCLAKSPGERPASFGDVLVTLSDIREIDALWEAPSGARSCAACGWISIRPCATCSICNADLGPGLRYAPVSQRTRRSAPTFGRSGDGRLVVEAVEVRPRVVREGETAVVTVLLGNPGSAPVENAFVPYVLPDPDAFVRPEGHRRGFRGSVPPTAPGAPLRVSWSVRPLSAGEFELAQVRATYRDADEVRRAVTGAATSLRVIPRDAMPLIGREREIEALERCLDASPDGAMIVLTGRRGLGKSRLARELRTRARARGHSVARGRCLDRGVEVRGALKEALRQLLALPQRIAGPAETAAALVALLGETARTDSQLVDFLMAELLGRALPRGESPGVMWSRFAETLGRQRPFLLVLEDVQRDRDVANVAVQMALRAATSDADFCVLVTARPELADGAAGRDFIDRVERLADQLGCAKVLRLQPLDDDAVAALVNEVLQPNDFDTSAPWLTRRVAELSGGNPLFVSEMLRSLRFPTDTTEPLVITRDGRFTVSDDLTPEFLDQTVPPRLEEMVLARLATLPPAILRVMRAAGVLGDVFETDLLRAVVDDDDAIDEAVRRMEVEGVLRETGSAVRRIRFREPLLPEILAREARSSAPDEFKELNSRAAEYLLAHGDTADRDALRLARHLAAAGRGDDAFRHRLRAARRLARRQSHRKAAVVLGEARALIDSGAASPTDEERTAFGMLRAEALRFSGDYAGALVAYQELTSASVGSGPSERDLAVAFSKMGKVQEVLGRLDEATRSYATGLSLRVALGFEHDVAMSLVNLAGLQLIRGEITRAQSYLERAIDLAGKSGSARALGRAHALVARLCAGRGETRQARASIRVALRCAREAVDRTTTADAWNTLGIVAAGEGRSVHALTYFLRALHLRQEIGDLSSIAASWNNVASVHEVLGQRVEALRGFERAVHLYRRIGSARGIGTSLASVGRMQLDAERPRRARKALDESARVLRGAGDPVAWGATLVESARTLLAISPPDGEEQAEVGSLLRRARTLVEGRGDHETEAAVAEGFAEWHRVANRQAEAVETARHALELDGLGPERRVALLSIVAESGRDADAARLAAEIAESGVGPWTRARALAAGARVRLATGDQDGAAALFRQAAGLLQQAERWGPLLLAVLRDGARVLRATDPAAADAALDRASELAARLEKRGYAAT